MSVAPTEPDLHEDQPNREAERHLPRRAVTGLSDRAAAGFVVLMFQSVLVRLVRFGGQLVLAWLLIPEDFGLFALAASLHQFVSVLKNAGLRDILIRRQTKLRLWVTSAFWMSVAMGLGGAAVMAAGAPVMAWFFHDDRLLLLVNILAVTTLVQSVGQVPNAVLFAELRFNLSATIEAVNNAGLMLLTVLFAWVGMGAVSFVLPMLVIGVLRTVYLWWIIHPPVRLDPQFRRWRYLMGDSVRLIGADIARTAVIQLPNMILGRIYPKSAVVGHYFYGYQLSIQSAWLFSRNLDTVLMPSLSKLQADADRHVKAFMRAIKTIAAGGIPLCFLQAAMAEPAVLLTLPEKFHPSIPYMVVLSLGMAGQLVVQPATAMLRSQGRFSVFAWLSWIQAVLFLSGVTLAALSSPLAAAGAVAAMLAVFGYIHIVVALKDSERPMLGGLMVFLWPTLLGGAATGAGYILSTLVPGEGWATQLGRLIVIGVVTLALYLPAIRVCEPETAREIMARSGGMLTKIIRRLPGRRSAG